MLLSAAVLLVGGAAQHFKPLFGFELLSYKTPVIGPVIMQAQLVMYSWSSMNAVFGPRLIGLLLATGHPLVYLAVFMFYLIRNSTVYTFFVGIFVWIAGLTGTLWGLLLSLAPIVLASARAYYKVHTLADTFPIMGASILAASVCFLDQMLSCGIHVLPHTKLYCVHFLCRHLRLDRGPHRYIVGAPAVTRSNSARQR
jgi:hypothetical protein